MAYGAILGQTANTYSKEQIMASTIPALYGLGSDAVPSDVLQVLGRFHAGLGNEYLWKKYRIEDSVVETPDTYVAFVYGGNKASTTVSAKFYPSYTVNSDGTFDLTGTAITLSGTYNSRPSIETVQTVVGYYTVNSTSTQDQVISHAAQIYRINPEFTVSQSGGSGSYGWAIQNSTRLTIQTFYTDDGYANSPDQTEYSTDESGGYLYEPLGRLGDRLQFIAGSYVGTGTAGSSNKNVLPIDFEPFFLVVTGDTYRMFWAAGNNRALSFSVASSGDEDIYSRSNIVSVTRENKIPVDINWYYTGTSAQAQLNESGKTYSYLILGVMPDVY